VRNGVASVFLAFEPWAGWHQVRITETRRRTDWACFVESLLEGCYREAERVVLVMDQLNTHSPASLYEAFAPEKAQRWADRLEIHDTPQHDSWLNRAEIELSMLSRDLPERRWPRGAGPARGRVASPTQSIGCNGGLGVHDHRSPH
jgi:DDE superfamily endonuclease